MSLIVLLNELGSEANNRFSTLNRGGCCVFAGLVAAELDARGYPVQGRVAAYKAGTPNPPTITEARKWVKTNTPAEWNAYGIVFGHVGIEFYDGENTYLYDSNGCVDPEELLDGMHSFEGRLTTLELNELWQNNGPLNGYSISWNTNFDRNNIPDLKKLVERHFMWLPVVA